MPQKVKSSRRFEDSYHANYTSIIYDSKIQSIRRFQDAYYLNHTSVIYGTSGLVNQDINNSSITKYFKVDQERKQVGHR
jgi:hypothetical protein